VYENARSELDPQFLKKGKRTKQSPSGKKVVAASVRDERQY
jgi:hypothetical protein